MEDVVKTEKGEHAATILMTDMVLEGGAVMVIPLEAAQKSGVRIVRSRIVRDVHGIECYRLLKREAEALLNRMLR